MSKCVFVMESIDCFLMYVVSTDYNWKSPADRLLMSTTKYKYHKIFCGEI